MGPVTCIQIQVQRRIRIPSRLSHGGCTFGTSVVSWVHSTGLLSVALEMIDCEVKNGQMRIQDCGQGRRGLDSTPGADSKNFSPLYPPCRAAEGGANVCDPAIIVIVAVILAPVVSWTPDSKIIQFSQKKWRGEEIHEAA